MFNFSANHLFLLSRTEYPSCAVFLLRDLGVLPASVRSRVLLDVKLKLFLIAGQ